MRQTRPDLFSLCDSPSRKWFADNPLLVFYPGDFILPAIGVSLRLAWCSFSMLGGCCNWPYSLFFVRGGGPGDSGESFIQML